LREQSSKCKSTQPPATESLDGAPEAAMQPGKTSASSVNCLSYRFPFLLVINESTRMFSIPEIGAGVLSEAHHRLERFCSKPRNGVGSLNRLFSGEDADSGRTGLRGLRAEKKIPKIICVIFGGICILRAISQDLTVPNCVFLSGELCFIRPAGLAHFR
jgi:hypothetical protein